MSGKAKAFGVIAALVIVLAAIGVADGVFGWTKDHITWSAADRVAYQRDQARFGFSPSTTDCMIRKFEYWGVYLSEIQAWGRSHEGTVQLFVDDCRNK